MGADSDVIKIARDYYDSPDADEFYFRVWGGEDIHIGLYESEGDDIRVASHRTVKRMAREIPNLGPDVHLLDCGAGYGGAARALASEFGCRVDCLNLSTVQNERNRTMNVEAGLDDRVRVFDGAFESLPFDDNTYDAVWSQDAFLHSGEKARVLDEINRVVKPGGAIVFTDPMQADDCPQGVLADVLARIHLSSLGSFAFYREQAARLGWREVAVHEMTEQLVRHYRRVGEELAGRRSELSGFVSEAYIDRMIRGLQHWVSAGQQGYLAWGILHFGS